MQAGASGYMELTTAAGERLACEHLGGRAPGVLFCPGFRSDMEGTKALVLREWCGARQQQFTRFDYSGHGRSGGRFSDGTIGAWLSDTLQVLDTVTDGPQVLVGSSMGGWLSLLAAMARPQRVAGLLLVAPAPDFTERLFNERLAPDQRAALARDGACEMPSDYDPEPYLVTQGLITEAREHLLGERPVPVPVPVRIIHGQLDDAVPWRASLALVDRLQSPDVELQLIKGGDHRLSSDADLARMQRCLDGLMTTLERTS